VSPVAMPVAPAAPVSPVAMPVVPTTSAGDAPGALAIAAAVVTRYADPSVAAIWDAARSDSSSAPVSPSGPRAPSTSTVSPVPSGPPAPGASVAHADVGAPDVTVAPGDTPETAHTTSAPVVYADDASRRGALGAPPAPRAVPPPLPPGLPVAAAPKMQPPVSTRRAPPPLSPVIPPPLPRDRKEKANEDKPE
ncbi:MAG: hypothetical protein IV100_23300, partial [Myxococcales bacterium]|nr:hypothetical protein [Myxococcales bacterium]